MGLALLSHTTSPPLESSSFLFPFFIHMTFHPRFSQLFHTDLHRYLLTVHRVDEMLPDAPDIEGRFESIAQAYLPDGIREFTAYPHVSLGWMMFIGMAVAKWWDTDWAPRAADDHLYEQLLAATDFDHLDDYICQQVLCLSHREHDQLNSLVGECAARTHSLLRRQAEAGTPEAFQAFLAALHELYTFGAAVQLKAMGYKMVKVD